MNTLDRIYQRLSLARRKGREHSDEYYSLPGCRFRCCYRGSLAAKQADQIVKTRKAAIERSHFAYAKLGYVTSTLRQRPNSGQPDTGLPSAPGQSSQSSTRPAAASSDRDNIDLDVSDIRVGLRRSALCSEDRFPWRAARQASSPEPATQFMTGSQRSRVDNVRHEGSPEGRRLATAPAKTPACILPAARGGS
jgi:hypothetical protein